jgi:hypothetical protein
MVGFCKPSLLKTAKPINLIGQGFYNIRTDAQIQQNGLSRNTWHTTERQINANSGNFPPIPTKSVYKLNKLAVEYP